MVWFSMCRYLCASKVSETTTTAGIAINHQNILHGGDGNDTNGSETRIIDGLLDENAGDEDILLSRAGAAAKFKPTSVKAGE